MKIATQIRFIRQLNKLAAQADRLDLALPNGGLVGSLLGTMADDLQQMWEVPNVCIEKQVQTSGPQCKNCSAFTTYARVNSHGLCMKCEIGG